MCVAGSDAAANTETETATTSRTIRRPNTHLPLIIPPKLPAHNQIRPTSTALTGSATTGIEQSPKKKKTALGDSFISFDALRRELFDYIDGFYNSRRIHTSIGWMSPMQYENQMAEVAV
jgi:transposase InsO family protein